MCVCACTNSSGCLPQLLSTLTTEVEHQAQHISARLTPGNLSTPLMLALQKGFHVHMGGMFLFLFWHWRSELQASGTHTKHFVSYPSPQPTATPLPPVIFFLISRLPIHIPLYFPVFPSSNHSPCLSESGLVYLALVQVIFLKK